MTTPTRMGSNPTGRITLKIIVEVARSRPTEVNTLEARQE